MKYIDQKMMWLLLLCTFSLTAGELPTEAILKHCPIAHRSQYKADYLCNEYWVVIETGYIHLLEIKDASWDKLFEQPLEPWYVGCHVAHGVARRFCVADVKKLHSFIQKIFHHRIQEKTTSHDAFLLSDQNRYALLAHDDRNEYNTDK